jgi:hypothetical protein
LLPSVHLPFLMLVGAGTLLLLILVPTFENAILALRVARGHYTRVEGRITQFVRGDPSHLVNESWSVVAGGHTYAYSYNPFTGSGYLGPTSPDKPLAEGSLVRIADVDGHIARLEVAY